MKYCHSKLNLAMYRLCVVMLIPILLAHADRSDKKITENCFGEVGISPEFYRSAMESDLRSINHKIKCVDACLLKAYKVMKKDGSIDLDEIMNLMPDFLRDDPNGALKLAVKTCNSIRGDDECTTAHLMMTCLHDEILKYFSDFLH